MTKKFKFINPILPEVNDIVAYLQPAYERKHFTNYGPACLELENRIEKKFATPGYRAISVTNATSGLQVVLEGIDVSGKYVIIPDFTFPATFHAVVAAGGIPLLCDVDGQTAELDPAAVKNALETYDTIAAVVHVRCFGFRRDISPLLETCSAREVPVIIDAAAGLGDERQPKFGSKFGEIEVFSLHTTKVFAAGEGGIILAPSHIAENARARTNFGLLPDRTFVDGMNAKMDEFRCSVGLAMLDKLPQVIAHRSKHVARLKEILVDSSTISTFDVDCNQTWCNFPVYSKCLTGDELEAAFAMEGIETKRYYYPLMSTGYKGQKHFKVHSSVTAEFFAKRVLCIPVYSEPVDNAFFNSVRAVVKKLEDR